MSFWASALEEELWILRARLAEQSGYLGADRTQEAVQTMLHEDEPC